MFLFSLHNMSERIDVSLFCATNYPLREKQLTADIWVWGSTPCGEVILRLIGLCGILWTWLHLLPTGLGFFLIGAMQTPWGIIPSHLSPTFFHLFHFRGLAAKSITFGFYTSATYLLGAHACYIQLIWRQSVLWPYLSFSIWYEESKIDWL